MEIAIFSIRNTNWGISKIKIYTLLIGFSEPFSSSVFVVKKDRTFTDPETKVNRLIQVNES